VFTVQSDSSSRLPKPPHHGLWTLPKILRVKISRVRYPNPRKHVVSGRIVEMADGIEIQIETDGEIPVRALSPALNVGGIELSESEQIDDRTYRFFVLDEQSIEDGAPIALGWVGVPSKPARSKFRYHLAGAKRPKRKR
jgi:hypothetical protein